MDTAPPGDDAPIFRRAIAIRNRSPGLTVGWLEDEFHHFGVSIEHDGREVLAARAATVRYPWTTCAESGAPLQRVVGLPLITRASDLGRMLPMAMQCTHIFELAALTIAHTTRRVDERRYEGRVTASADDILQAWLTTDGVDVLSWDVRGDGAILVPQAELAGVTLTTGFRQWCEAMDEQEAEHAWVLRRVAWLALGDRSFRQVRIAAETGLGPVCHTYQPEQRFRALAMERSRRSPASAKPLLANLDEIP